MIVISGLSPGLARMCSDERHFEHFLPVIHALLYSILHSSRSGCSSSIDGKGSCTFKTSPKTDRRASWAGKEQESLNKVASRTLFLFLVSRRVVTSEAD